MVGELWVDKGQQRLVKIDAHLISDVNFGWGVLGRLCTRGEASWWRTPMWGTTIGRPPT